LRSVSLIYRGGIPLKDIDWQGITGRAFCLTKR
jgi:hypothetical protein